MKSIDGIIRQTPSDHLDYVSFPKVELVKKPLAPDAEELLNYTSPSNRKPEQKKSFLTKSKLFFVSGVAVASVLAGSSQVGDILNMSKANLTGQGVNLDVPALSAKVAQNYLAANVEVTSLVGEGDALKNYASSECTGTAIGNGKIETAAHCLRYVKGDTATPRPPLKQLVQVYNGASYFGDKHEHYYPEYRPDVRTYDVAVIDTSDDEQASVPLATELPKVGESIYFYSRFFDDDNARIVGGKIIERPDAEVSTIVSLFKLDNPKHQACMHGTSGTGVINQSGQLVGTVSALTEPFKLGLDQAITWGVNPNDAGDNVQLCDIVPVNTLRPLAK